MLIREITQVDANEYLGVPARALKSTPRTPRYELSKVLEQKGWVSLGSGAYGEVFENPNKSFVLKVFTRQDTGYQAFIRFAQKHSRRHLPRFSSHILRLTPHFRAVAMEKLIRIPDQSGAEIAEAVNGYLVWIRSKHSNKNFIKYIRQKETFVWLQQTQPEIFRVLRGLITVKRQNREVRFDIHRGNFMWRHRVGGDLVITDPFTDNWET